MSFLPIAIAGLSALGGALGNRSSTQTTSDTKTGTDTVSPNYDPRALSFRDSIINNYLRMMQPQNFDMSGYQANAISDINRTRQLQQQKNQEMLAAHGISGPAQVLSSSGIDNQRFSDIVQLQNQIPLLRQQMMGQVAQNAGQFFNSIPYGQTTNFNERTTGTQTNPGNILGGAVGGGASALAYLYGQGAFNSKAPTYPNIH